MSILPVGFGLAAADGADHSFADTKEGLQTFLPLLEQFGSMHQHQGIHAAPGDHRCRRDRLAEGGGRAQHAGIVAQHRRDGRFLIGAQACRRS